MQENTKSSEKYKIKVITPSLNLNSRMRKTVRLDLSTSAKTGAHNQYQNSREEFSSGKQSFSP